jgi:hypothetical protein
VLHDLYLGDTARALVLLQRAADLLPAEAPLLGRWLAEMKARLGATSGAPKAASPAPKDKP